MANVKATPILSQRISNGPPPKTQFNPRLKSVGGGKVLGIGRWVTSDFSPRMKRMGIKGQLRCSDPNEGGVRIGEQDGYLVREFGWGVRRMVEVGDEMRRVAEVQAEAFHVPVALFDDLFLEFFKAEVLSALIYKLRNSPRDRYACLVTEPTNVHDSPWEMVKGVVDITVQRERDVLSHLEGADEYLYVSGIAVLTNFRRQRIGTVLLKACDAMSLQWGFSYLVLRAYEDDLAARKLYSNAGYRVVSADPPWISWIGRKRRVLMIKQSVTTKNPYR